MIDDKTKDDIFYICTLIEFISRKTKNHRNDVISRLSQENLEHELKVAQVNHCLSFDQVADEWISKYGVVNGDFDTESTCRYTVPSVTAIGRVYQQLVLSNVNTNTIIQSIISVFNSFISDAISNFNSSLYYSSPDYLRCSYEQGYILD